MTRATLGQGGIGGLPWRLQASTNKKALETAEVFRWHESKSLTPELRRGFDAPGGREGEVC